MSASLQLVRGYVRYRPLAAVLSVGLLALGVGLLSLLVLLDRQLTRQFERNLAGVDLVIGAKGSPLQLVASSIYHADAPTGNVPVAEVRAFGRPGHPLIERAVPIGLGDSYRGRRIVGTTPAFLDLYGASVAEGRPTTAPFDVVAGASAARAAGLRVGDEFASVHGLDDNPDLTHGEGANRFRVSGILAPTGLVVDELLVTPLTTVWAVHDQHGHDGDDHAHDGHAHGEHAREGHAHDDEDYADGAGPWYTRTDESITALLADFSARNTATLNFARNVNENTDLMAATPAVVMAQFSSQVAGAEQVVRALGLVIVLASLASLVIVLLNALRERRGDLRLLRALGASAGFVLRLILLESVALALAGALLGLALGRVGFYALGEQLEGRYPVGLRDYGPAAPELYVAIGAIGAAVLAAAYPAWRAYRLDVGLGA